MTDKIDISIDSTALSTSGCILNFKRTVLGELVDGKPDNLGGYRSPQLDAVVVYGIAVHGFIDTILKTQKGSEAKNRALELFNMPKMAPPEKKGYLGDPNHLITTCYNLWTQWINEESTFEILQIPVKCYWCDGNKTIEVLGSGGDYETHECQHCAGKGIVIGPATELTFSVLIYEDNLVRIHLKGTIDTLGKFKGGCYAIRDFKTTGQWNKESYLSQYDLSRQLRIYLLACKLEGKSNPDSPLGKAGLTNMGAFIDGIFLKPKANDNEYARSAVFQFKEDDLNTFHETLLRFCSRLSAAIQLNEFPKEGILNGSCMGTFGLLKENYRCKFWSVCKSPEPVAQLLLRRDFKRKIYDPLSFNEEE